jgi:hypothetical protein
MMNELDRTTYFDPFSVAKFDAGEERRRRKENQE